MAEVIDSERSHMEQSHWPPLDREPEALHRQVSRLKARWLQTVMYSNATSAEKVLAYVVYDFLNCVTLDAWPAQGTIAERMCCSTKTVQRAADGLEGRGCIVIARSRRRDAQHRYAPVFMPGDMDKIVRPNVHFCPERVDGVVHQSSSSIHIESAPTGQQSQIDAQKPKTKYRRAERGRWEQEVARALGPDGSGILGRLAIIDDAVVERLCRAFCDGEVGGREIAAARLAANQMPDAWRIW